MLETARKGRWNATEQQLTAIADLHVELVKEFGVSGSDFTADNKELQEYLADKASAGNAGVFKQQLQKIQTASESFDAKDGMVLKKNEISSGESATKTSLNGILIVSAVLVSFIVLLILIRKRRRNNR